MENLIVGIVSVLLFAYLFLDLGGRNGRTPVGEPFVEIFLETEMVAISLDRKVITIFGQRLQCGFDIADVQPGLGHGSRRWSAANSKALKDRPTPRQRSGG